MNRHFNHKEIESKWQAKWKASQLYKTSDNSDKPKAFVLDMFPYPSGEGLHVGHPKGYIATDIYSRFKRMTGHEVLHPMGWDAFGLPAENYAIKHKVHPREAVDKNVARFKEQLEVLGFDYDWDREMDTTDPSFYKWTQWIFIQLFKKGLAYESYEPINWCPGCQTGLANEDLEPDGTCERCDSVVEQRPMRQWVLKIKEYADRMLADLDTLDWPEHIKEAQRNWIGHSEGAEIDFELSVGEKVTVFTTRPDTLYGATYMVLSPEHELVQKYKAEITNWDEVQTYIEATKNKKEQDRLDDTKEKTGVKLQGVAATNPANGESIPVYIADYVLAGYGTGAIMAVPAHDERDFAFAQKFGIEAKEVVLEKIGSSCSEEKRIDAVMGIVLREDGKIILQRDLLNDNYRLPGGGLKDKEIHVECLIRELREETGYNDVEVMDYVGSVWVHFFLKTKNTQIERKLSVYEVELKSQDSVNLSWDDDEKLEHAWVTLDDAVEKLSQNDVDMGELTLLKRYKEKKNIYFSSKGCLVNSEEFNGTTSEEAGKAIVEKVGGRMTSTYKIKDWVFSRQRYWGEPIPIIHCEKCGPVTVPEDQLPVTLPEVEHYEPSGDGQSPLATIDWWVNTTCPECGGAGKRETNTMPQWAGSSWYYLRYMDPHNDKELVSAKNEQFWSPVDVYVGGDHAVRHLIYVRFWHKFLYDLGKVSTIEPFQRLEFLGFILAEDGRKMSKRWGNVINPDDIVELVGADTLRIYEMFMGPFENNIAWSQDGLVGARRFLERVNGLSGHVAEGGADPKETITALHKMIKKVGEDIVEFKFNTAISAMMIFLNQAEKSGLSRSTYEIFLRVLAPFAPHLTEELWRETGIDSIHITEFPIYDPAFTKDEMVTIGVQINGKMRGKIILAPTALEAEALSLVNKNTILRDKLTGSKIKKVVYVQGRILNIVVS